MTSESLEENDLCLPLLSTEKGDASFLEEDLSSYSCNKVGGVLLGGPTATAFSMCV